MSLSPNDFRDLRDRTKLSCKAIAVMFEIDERLVRRWATGRIQMPPEMAAWLIEYAALWSGRPVPAPAWFTSEMKEAG